MDTDFLILLLKTDDFDEDINNMLQNGLTHRIMMKEEEKHDLLAKTKK